MIENTQIKGLEKLLNSDVIKNIYPIVGEIEVHNSDNPFDVLENTLHLNIYLNEPIEHGDDLWDKFNFDEYWMVDHHVRRLLPYLGIDNDKTSIRFSVYDTNMDMIKTNDF
jgi:hypothetical protein